MFNLVVSVLGGLRVRDVNCGFKVFRREVIERIELRSNRFAIEPEMTLVVPLAAGIVERRGGMLIHGAIVAREYGIPCVTGVPEAASLIHTGDHITVDGYLGIVIVD